MIRDRLVGGLQASRESILNHRIDILSERLQMFAALYMDWWEEQPRAITLPRPIELMDHPEVREIVEQDSFVHVDLTDLYPLQGCFSKWAEEWRVEKNGQLRALLREVPGLSRVEEDTDLLELACAAFDCSSCGEEACFTRVIPPLYPSLLDHECLYERTDEATGGPYEIAAQFSTMESDDYASCVSLKWSSLPLTVGVWHARAVEIITACGEDPYGTTRKEMDACRVRLWCEHCDAQSDEDLRQVFRWRDCVSGSVLWKQLNF